MNKLISKLHVSDVLVYLLYIVIMVLMIGTQKINWHLDEVFSYGLSNFTGEDIVLPVEDGKTYYPPQQIWSTGWTRSYLEACSFTL